MLSAYSATLFAQVDTDFWFVVPELSHRGNTGGTPGTLRIATLELDATVTIEMPANPGFTPIVLNIAANDEAAVDLTYLIDYLPGNPGVTGLENKALTPNGINSYGLHITSTNMINVYWEVNYIYGSEVWTLKGSNGLGNLFYTPFQTEYPNHFTAMPSYSAIDIVASQDNTTITFTLPDGVGASFGEPMNTTQSPATPGRTFSIGPLNRGETFSLFPYMRSTTVAAKLDGTRISSDNPIAVVVKDDNLNTASQGRSTIGDQLVPVDVTGDTYVVPAMGNPNLTFIVATQDNTNIYVNGPGGTPTLIATLNEGEQLRYQSPNNTIMVISSKNGISAPPGPPIYVFHLAINNMTRAAALLPPIGCTGNTQLAFTRAREAVREDFYFFVITEDENIDDFWIDGAPADPTIISDDAAQWDRLGNGWSAFKSRNIPASKLAIGQHLVENTGGIFHLGIINGFTSANLGDLLYGYFSDYGGLNVGAVVAGTNSSVIRACYGTPVQLHAYGGTQYEWTPHDYLDDPYSNLPTAINLPAGAHQYTAHVSGTCGSGDVPITVMVAPPVTASFETNVVSGCSPLEVVFEDLSEGNATWQYDLGDGTPLILYDTISFTSIPFPPDPFTFTNTYVNNTDSVISFEVTLMVKNSSACADIITKTITVFPEIHSDFEVAPIIACDPLESFFTNNSNGDTAYWFWDFGDGGSSTEFEPVHEFRNRFGPDNLQFDVSLVAISPYNCRDTSWRSVTVRPYIEASFAYDTVAECSPHEIIITDQSIGADTYLWDFGDGNTSTSAGPVLRHTYNNTTPFPVTYTITLRVDNEEGCTHTIQRDVTVFPGVNADFVATPVDACSPAEIVFQNTTTGPAVSYLWDFGDGGSSTEEHPIHYYDRNMLRHDTVFTVMLVATTNEFCRDTAIFDIVMHPYIEAAFTVDDVVGCTPFSVEINNESIGVDNYYWDFGDGSPVSNDPSAVFTHTYVNADTTTTVYPLRLIVTNEEGCRDTMIRDITVHPLITASFSTSGLDGCHPLTVTFTNLSQNAETYLWDFGDGAASVEFSPVHTFTNFGATDTVYLVTLTTSTADGECVESISFPISVYPQVVSEFTFPYAQGCGPFEVTFENLSIGGDQFTWDFGDGTVVNTPLAEPQTHVFVNTLGNGDPQDFDVSLLAENIYGCSNEVIKTVTVYPDIVAGFDVSDSVGCHPLQVDFTNLTTGGGTYVWDFGDGTSTNLENPVHIFTNTGTADSIYTVKLYTLAPNNTCDDSIFMDIRVHPYVQANFTLPVSLECNPFDAEIINTSVNADTFYWDFGDGTNAITYNMDPVYHQFTNDGNWTGQQDYEITLVAENYAGCIDEIRRTITVEPDIMADFNASDTVGCHPLTINFSNLSMGGTINHWDFGNGTTSQELSPTHTFTNTGTTDSTYRVWLYTTGSNNLCRDSMYVDIRVHPYIQANFTVPVSLGCNPFDVELINASVNADTFYWDFGDGTNAVTYNLDPVYHQFNNNGNYVSQQDYEITLVAENYAGCTDEIRRTITVEPDIHATFNASDTVGCHPLTVNFTNLSQGAAINHWDFGNGTTSQELSPTQTFTNIGSTDSTYRVWLYTTASNNVCGDSFFVDIVVHPYIFADFTFQEQVNCTPSEVEFHNASIGGDVFYWDFGDGTLDTTYNMDPVNHVFNNSSFVANAVFTVTLRAENFAGCTDQITRVVEVYPAIEAVIDPSVLEGCHPLEVSFTNLTQGGYTYAWDFGDGATSEVSNPVHTFTNFTGAPITRTVRLHARSQFNCTSDTTVDITIYPKPTARYETEQFIACAPFEVPVNNTSIYGDQFTWTFGSDTSFTMTSMDPVSHTFDNQTADIATYRITLLAETSFGCLDTAEQDVYVYPGTIADFSFNDGDCSPFMAYFVNESVRGQTYVWDFGDGTTASTPEPSNLYFNLSGQDTVFYITLTSTSRHGCVDSHTDSVNVYAQPHVEFFATPTHQMYPDATVDFTNVSNQGYWTYQWDLGDGSTSNLENPPAHTYDTWGNYVIWLSAATPYCSDSVSHSIRILPAAPVAAFDTVLGACEPYTVQFTNNSIYGSSYLWEFDDGTTSTEFEPVHTFQENGYYNVKLTVTSQGGTDYAYSVVEVYRMPLVDFRVEPTLVMLPDDEIRLFNLSEYGSYYIWDFGDGNTSTEEHPRHLYTEEGQYDISLEVTTEHGCVDQLLKQGVVTVEGEGVILFPNAFKPDMHGPNGGIYDLRAEEKNNIFHPYWEGVAEYNLEIYTRWGEKLFSSNDVNWGWDGYFKENLCKQDVYVFKCWGVFVNGELFQVKGDVTLLHHDKL